MYVRRCWSPVEWRHSKFMMTMMMKSVHSCLVIVVTDRQTHTHPHTHKPTPVKTYSLAFAGINIIWLSVSYRWLNGLTYAFSTLPKKHCSLSGRHRSFYFSTRIATNWPRSRFGHGGWQRDGGHRPPLTFGLRRSATAISMASAVASSACPSVCLSLFSSRNHLKYLAQSAWQCTILSQCLETVD